MVSIRVFDTSSSSLSLEVRSMQTGCGFKAGCMMRAHKPMALEKITQSTHGHVNKKRPIKCDHFTLSIFQPVTDYYGKIITQTTIVFLLWEMETSRPNTVH